MSAITSRRTLVQASALSGGVLLVALLLGMGNYFGLKYYKRFDWTGSNLYSLSGRSAKVLGQVDREIEAVLFMQPGSELFDPARELLERYAAASPRIKLRVVDPERNLVEARQVAERYQLSNLNVVVFDAGKDRRVVEEADLAEYDYSGLQYGGAPELKGFKGEEAFTSAILELVEERKPKIIFTSGHGEAAIDEFGADGLSQARDLLGKDNFAMETWASLGKPAVPEATDLLVIAGPSSGFVEPELAVLSQYIEQGGRILVLLDPTLGRNGGLVETNLGRWLAGYGVKVGDDIVVDPANPLPFFGAETFFVYASGGHPAVKSLEQAKVPVIFPLARSVGRGSPPEGVEATELLRTGAEGWGETDLANLSGVAKGEGDTPGPVSLAVAVAPVEKGKSGMDEMNLDEEAAIGEEQETEVPAASGATSATPTAPSWRVVVFGDSDFATNGQLANVGNSTLLVDIMNWLVERENLLGIQPKKPEQVRLNLTRGQLATVAALVLGGLPGLAVLAGVVVYLRRRR